MSGLRLRPVARERYPRGRDMNSDKSVDKLADGLKDLVIGASGRIPKSLHEDIKRLVEDCGAKFVEKGFQDCTHLVTTLKDGRVRSRKVTPADEQGCHTVSMDWLLGTIKKKAPEKIKEFLLKHKTLRRAFRGALVVANNDRGHTGPKRDREDDSDGDDGVSKKAVVSSAKADMDASMKIKRERNSEGLAKLVEDKFKEKGKKLTVWLDDSGFIWDVTLVKLDEELSHQLMRMQIIHAAGPNEAWAWRCKYHSSIDSTPTIKSSGHSESRFEDFASARTKFEYLFKTFTGVQWNYRGSKSLPAHWVFVDLNPSADLIDCDIEGVTAEVLAILEMIFSKKYAEAYAKALETSGGTYNFTTKEGRRRLRLAVACMQMHMKLGASSIDGNTPSDLDFVFRNLVHPNIPEPRSTAQDQKDQTMFEALDLLLKLQNAHNLMAKADCSATSLSQIYQSLGVAKMDLVDDNSAEHTQLCEYLMKTSSPHHPHQFKEVINIFRLERPGEEDRFAQWQSARRSRTGDRRLLWHGFGCANFAGILIQGLRGAGIVSVNGKSFVPGVYFADISTKSAGYSGQTANQECLILLCEVELGADDSVATRLVGRTTHKKWRSAEHIHPRFANVKVPDISAGTVNGAASLYHSEYVAYNPAQVIQRYLFHIKMQG